MDIWGRTLSRCIVRPRHSISHSVLVRIESNLLMLVQATRDLDVRESPGPAAKPLAKA